MDTIQQIFVSSSNVQALGYDENTQTLRVWFLNGSVYDYGNVSLGEFEGLKNAPSIGSYFARMIKGSYPYSKVA